MVTIAGGLSVGIGFGLKGNYLQFHQQHLDVI